MPNTNDYVVLDLDSGTYFSLERAVLINCVELTPDQVDVLENGSDMTRSELGDEIGEWLPNALGWENVCEEEVIR